MSYVSADKFMRDDVVARSVRLQVVIVTLPVVGGKVLATQMGARVVETQYGKLRGVLVTLSNRRLVSGQSVCRCAEPY